MARYPQALTRLEAPENQCIGQVHVPIVKVPLRPRANG